jgi:cell division protein ZapA
MSDNVKRETEVMIGGKVYTLSGYESEEYLQRVAIYINNKFAEYNQIESFRKQGSDFKSLLVQLNIADDYFREKDRNAELEDELERKEREIYDLKHELVASQIKIDSTEKTMQKMQDEISVNTKQIVRLETELRASGK